MKAQRRLARLMPLIASTCLFFVGVGTLVWTAGNASDPTAPASVQSPVSTLAAEATDATENAASDITTPIEREAAEKPSDTAEQESKPTKETATDRTDTEPSKAPPSSESGRESAVRYKTIRHKAAIARKIKVGDRTIIQWQLCPACGKRHDAGYDERIVER